MVHCPYCHGYEIGGRAVGVGTGPMSVHQAMMFADLGRGSRCSRKAWWRCRPKSMHSWPRARSHRGQPDCRAAGHGARAGRRCCWDGRRVAIKALLVGTQVRMASPLAEALGCAFEDSPFGPIVRIDAWGTTSVDGVYAAGDMARVPHSITFATASGVAAGIRLHSSLITEDAQRSETAAA